jgi:hypothetical protein
VAVLLANRRLGVRRRTAGGVGAHGDRLKGSWGPTAGPWPGRAEEGADVPEGQTGGRAWNIATDAASWPLAQGDLVVDVDSGEEWLVTSADLRRNNADPAVDYVAVNAHVRTGADGTRP